MYSTGSIWDVTFHMACTKPLSSNLPAFAVMDSTVHVSRFGWPYPRDEKGHFERRLDVSQSIWLHSRWTILSYPDPLLVVPYVSPSFFCDYPSRFILFQSMCWILFNWKYAIHIHMYIRICIHVFAYVYTYIYMYIRVYIYTHCSSVFHAFMCTYVFSTHPIIHYSLLIPRYFFGIVLKTGWLSWKITLSDDHLYTNIFNIVI